MSMTSAPTSLMTLEPSRLGPSLATVTARARLDLRPTATPTSDYTITSWLMDGRTSAAPTSSTVMFLHQRTCLRTTSSQGQALKVCIIIAALRMSPRTISSIVYRTQPMELMRLATSGAPARPTAASSRHLPTTTTSTFSRAQRTWSSTSPTTGLMRERSLVTTYSTVSIPKMSSRECFLQTTSPSLTSHLLEVSGTSGRIQCSKMSPLLTSVWLRAPPPSRWESNRSDWTILEFQLTKSPFTLKDQSKKIDNCDIISIENK